MLSPSRSVALPLPSSPHCAPTITMAGMSAGPLPLHEWALGEEPGRRGGAAVGQEHLAALSLVLLADGVGGDGQGGQRAQEALVGLMLPGHGPVALPAGPAQ